MEKKETGGAVAPASDGSSTGVIVAVVAMAITAIAGIYYFFFYIPTTTTAAIGSSAGSCADGSIPGANGLCANGTVPILGTPPLPAINPIIQTPAGPTTVKTLSVNPNILQRLQTAIQNKAPAQPQVPLIAQYANQWATAASLTKARSGNYASWNGDPVASEYNAFLQAEVNNGWQAIPTINDPCAGGNNWGQCTEGFNAGLAGQGSPCGKFSGVRKSDCDGGWAKGASNRKNVLVNEEGKVKGWLKGMNLRAWAANLNDPDFKADITAYVNQMSGSKESWDTTLNVGDFVNAT